VSLLRELPAERKRRDVVFVAIGPLVNLQGLLESGPNAASPLTGRELIARSVDRLVLMGGMIPEGREYNFLQAPEAARAVLTLWPGRTVICGAEIGAAVRAGAGLQMTSASNPVRAAYKLHCGGVDSASYDLITVEGSTSGRRASMSASNSRGALRPLAQR
jgi:Inosine-uridine preferring nucleoside hydrolase